VTIPANKLVVLDTNVLVHLLRDNATGKKIESEFRLSSRAERPLLCSIVEGEILGLAQAWNWGSARFARMYEQLNQLVRVSAGEPEVIKAYGELFANQRKKGLLVGENDLWIASTAKTVGATIITCDTDFQSLDPREVDYRYVSPVG
jgi:tRNA(fMet)-specific endonuclease VapC